MRLSVGRWIPASHKNKHPYRPQMLMALLAVLYFNICSAQGKFYEYESETGNITVNAGDTVVFKQSSLNGAYAHVFFNVGSIQKRRASFTSDYYSELVVDHFLRRKEDGESKVFAVLAVPNKPKWFVWVRLEDALATKEIEIK